MYDFILKFSVVGEKLPKNLGDTFCLTLYVSVAGTLNTCCEMNVHICDLSEHFMKLPL